MIHLVLSLIFQAIFTEEPQLARWEDSQQVWRTDGFEDVEFDEMSGTISFKSQFIGPIVTLQVLCNEHI